MKQETKKLIAAIIVGLFQTVMILSILLTFCGFFLVFLNSNLEYFQELPVLIRFVLPFGLPIGFIGIIFKIVTMDWFSIRKNINKKQK